MTFEQWVQSRLTAHGYPVGLIDGKIGPVTIKAIEAFQKAHGLPVNGKADDATVAALRGSASVVPDDVKADIPSRDYVLEVVDMKKPVWPRQSECARFYGKVGTNQTQIDIPFDMYLAWNKTTRIRKITVHQKVAASATSVFQTIAGLYSSVERSSLGLNLFGGSLNVRKMRGGTNYSMHSWGIAIDFDPERNGLSVHKPYARLSHDDAVPFWKAWEAEGWLSLGRARNFDWMHVQAARL
jgi:hypothetical protein